MHSTIEMRLSFASKTLTYQIKTLTQNIWYIISIHVSLHIKSNKLIQIKMKTLNAIFTPSQLIGVITILVVVVTVVTLLITKDFSSFANQIQ